ncbi:MAG: hypothetical protein ABGZ35_24510, partial [Planctomycetaceae bacterium]
MACHVIHRCNPRRLLSLVLLALFLKGLQVVLLLALLFLVVLADLLQPPALAFQIVVRLLQLGLPRRVLPGLLFQLCPLLVEFRLAAFEVGTLIVQLRLALRELLLQTLLLFDLPPQIPALQLEGLLVFLERGSLVFQIILQGIKLGVTLFQSSPFVGQCCQLPLEFRSLALLSSLPFLEFLGPPLPLRLLSLELCALFLKDPPLVLMLRLVFGCDF